ncbi:MAG: hypothetical protein PS018_21045 [bacterium]|nr:hypothetical protein [bacterium]
MPTMNSPRPAAHPIQKRSPARRIAATVALSMMVFVTLWILAFGWLTSLLIGAGCCAVMVAASTVSDIVEMVLDVLATAVFAVLAVLAAVFGEIFSLFDF